MSLFLGILLAFLVFLIVVLIHEFGHFFMARLTKMRVEEFWFGIPPKAFSIWRDKKGTEYTWNWFPIGGFVRIFWEDPTGEDAFKVWAFMSRPWYQRIIVLLAWVTMNFILAWVIFSWLFFLWTKPIAVNPLADGPTGSFFLPSFDEALNIWYISHDGVEITSLSGSLAEASGIWSSEQVTRVDDRLINTPDDFIDTVRSSTWIISILLKTDDIERQILIEPVNSKIWVQVGYRNLDIDTTYSYRLPLDEALVMWVRETYVTSVMTLSFLWQLVQWIFAPEVPQDRVDAKNMLSWPIWVWATFVWLVEVSAPISVILVIIALISVNLWVFNLLPIPALDGWRVVTTTLYSLVVRFFHSGVDRFMQFERYFHAVGFILLMVLTLYVAGLDISRFF
jgi:regulator of sigma E protease